VANVIANKAGYDTSAQFLLVQLTCNRAPVRPRSRLRAALAAWALFEPVSKIAAHRGDHPNPAFAGQRMQN
jgi:hypothetical protein